LKRGFASKIVVPTPICDLDGDEMTRMIWKWIKERHINPYVDLQNVEYFDLSVTSRDETND
jgi:isocitrate dehydrogenase